MTQPLLWDDAARLPDEYARFFQTYRQCPNCRMPLTNHMHALNHWRRCHVVKEKSMPNRRSYCYWVWRANAQTWIEVSYKLYLACRRNSFATARSKPGVWVSQSKAA